MPSTIGPTTPSAGLLLAGGFWSQESAIDAAVETALDGSGSTAVFRNPFVSNRRWSECEPP